MFAEPVNTRCTVGHTVFTGGKHSVCHLCVDPAPVFASCVYQLSCVFASFQGAVFTVVFTPTCESRPLFGQGPLFAAYRGFCGPQEVDQGRGPARVPSVPRGFGRPPRPRPALAQRTQGKVRISVDFGRLLIKVRFHRRTTLKLPISVDFCAREYLSCTVTHVAATLHVAV